MGSSVPEVQGGFEDVEDREEFTRSLFRTEAVFSGLLLVFGIVFALLIPPCQVPDEFFHFLRAYGLSYGHVKPTHITDGWGGDVLPTSTTRFLATFGPMCAHSDVKATWAEFQSLTTVPGGVDAPVPISFGGAVMYTFVPYLPSAVGIGLARALSLNPLYLFYMGRLTSLALAVVLVYLAIRITPVYKYAFGAIALMPMSIQQMASYSADSSVMGVGLLLVAVLLRLALLPGPRARPRTLACLLGLTVWLTLSKFPYAAVILLFAAVPAARLGSRARYLLMGSVLAVLVVVLVAGSIHLSRGYAPDSHNVGPYWNSLQKQTEYIKSHKIKYIKICIKTCIEYGSNWIETLSILGFLDTGIHRLSSYFFNIFLVVLAVIDQPFRVRPSARMKIAALIAFGIAFGLLLTAQYTWHSPVGGRIIEGIQGRYLIPLFPLFVILLNFRSIQVRADRHALQVLVSTVSVAYLIIATGAIIQRYYLADPAKLLAPMHVIGVALLCAGAFAVVMKKAQFAASPAAPPTSSLGGGIPGRGPTRIVGVSRTGQQDAQPVAGTADRLPEGA